MTGTPATVGTGPGLGLGEVLPGLRALRRAGPAGSVVVNRGWDLDWERVRWQESAEQGREHLSVRLYHGEVQVGPRWVPGSDSGCPCCVEVRGRGILAHPLVDELGVACSVPSAGAPLLPELLEAALAHLANTPLGPGDMYAVGIDSVRRHRITRSVHCPVCSAPPAELTTAERPARLVLRARPLSPADPTRATRGTAVLDCDLLHRDLVDSRYGPVQAILREATAPFAMSMAVLAEAPAVGHGRARTFPDTEPVAVLEAYERIGGFPFDAPVLTGLSHAEVAAFAVDPATLGRYTAEQLAHSSSRVVPSDAGTPMDWVWGHDLADGAPVLVPADIGFYQYEYAFRRARRAARAAGAAGQRHYFHESSSGCAVGSSVEEAALHALFEVAERDAFLLAWHRQVPLPAIDPASVSDPSCRLMLELVEARGFDVHLLVATQDVDLPVVWALAVNRSGGFPAAFSSAGSGADPASAVRGALREVAQLLTMELDWTLDDVAPMVADPWLVTELEHHVQRYTAPATLPRTTSVLGGPRLHLRDAFPEWPGQLRRAARGDVRGALHHVRELFGNAGMDRVVLVDQSTRDHADAGIAVVKAVVPRSLPMCFGHAQQRLGGLARLDAALTSAGAGGPLDPHPFP